MKILRIDMGNGNQYTVREYSDGQSIEYIKEGDIEYILQTLDEKTVILGYRGPRNHVKMEEISVEFFKGKLKPFLKEICEKECDIITPNYRLTHYDGGCKEIFYDNDYHILLQKTVARHRSEYKILNKPISENDYNTLANELAKIPAEEMPISETLYTDYVIIETDIYEGELEGIGEICRESFRYRYDYVERLYTVNGDNIATKMISTQYTSYCVNGRYGEQDSDYEEEYYNLKNILGISNDHEQGCLEEEEYNKRLIEKIVDNEDL